MTVGLGINVVLSLVAVTCSACVSPVPAVIPVRFTVCRPAFLLIAAGSAMASKVGGWFTRLTITLKVRATVASSALPMIPSRPAFRTVTVT